MADLKEMQERARFIRALLDQGEVWFPNGKPRVQITDMDPAWRHNAAAFMLRHAQGYLFHYDLGEIATFLTGPLAPNPDSMAFDSLERGMEEAQDERSAAPEAWLKSTALYKALVKDLPENAAELAKHWSDCAIRTDGGACSCQERHLSECPKRADINERCRCRDYDPEWTI
jgi:hypothetical protein